MVLLHVLMNSAVLMAIAALPDDEWTTIKYPRAIWDEQEQRWISEAQVAETTFTAFSSAPKKRQVTCRLIVRRVQRLNPGGSSRPRRTVHPVASPRFVTNSTVSTVAADVTHRDHAIIEQVILKHAELKDWPLAHAPSGKFTALPKPACLRRERLLVQPNLQRPGAGMASGHSRSGLDLGPR